MALVSSIAKVLERIKLSPRIEITSSDKSRERVKISFPGLEFRDKIDTKFSLVARLDLNLKISMLSRVNSELQRRSFSALMLVTAVFLLGPPALAMEVDEIRPGVPKKDMDFEGGVFLARVQRPVSLAAAYESQGLFLEGKQDGDEEFEEILEISIVVPRSELTAFNVFINLPQADESSPITLPEFVGSFASGEVDKPGPRRIKVRYGISDKIKLLNLEREPSILVAMVRQGDVRDVKITVKDIDIELE